MLDKAPRFCTSFCTENVELPINLLAMERAVPVAFTAGVERVVAAIVAWTDFFIYRRLFDFSNIRHMVPGLHVHYMFNPRHENARNGRQKSGQSSKSLRRIHFQKTSDI